MQFANVNNSKTEATKGSKGTCPACGRPVIAKCGQLVRWHWAHLRAPDCDEWWESETEWHRAWKERFPREWREVVTESSSSGEKHIADIRTPLGLTIEFQHSTISEIERRSREDHYGQLLWVVDGVRFIHRFEAVIRLPPPSTKLAQTMAILKQSHSLTGFESNAPGQDLVLVTEDRTRLDRFQGIAYKTYDQGLFLPEEQLWTSTKEALLAIDEVYDGHYLIKWNRPHKSWLTRKSTVFIDDRRGSLWQLVDYPQGHLCAKQWSIDEFINYVVCYRQGS